MTLTAGKIVTKIAHRTVEINESFKCRKSNIKLLALHFSLNSVIKTFFKDFHF